MTLTRRLLASYLVLIVASGAALVVAADRLLRARLVDDAGDGLERETAYLARAVAGLEGTALDSVVHALGRQTGRRLTVIDTTGALLADSDFPLEELSTLENHAARPEFRAALSGGLGRDLRRSTSTGRWELKVARPIPGGAARVSSPMPQVDAVVRRAQGAVLAGALIAAGVGILLALGFARSVARPLVRLRDAAHAITQGERPVVDTRGRDEVGEMARALRTLDENLTTRLADLERERSEMAALIASMVEGVIACDSRGAITTLNPAARRLLGFGPGDAAPSAFELFRQRPAREAVQATLGGGAVAGVQVDFDIRTVLLSGQPLEGGGAVLVLYDVSELKRLEAVRRDFVANVSHELKTPLTVVRGYAETLLKDDPPAEVRRGFLETMLANASRMQRLVDDLLDLSRIESGAWRPQPETLSLGPVLEEAWRGLRDRAAAGSLAYEATIEAGADAVYADPHALLQILSNVLDNAVRYTPPGGRITVVARREDAGAIIEIRDTGHGIAGEHLPRIFERFYRADAARSRELGGTGLGLAIVKHLAEAHGGRVEAESALGAGTTIRLVMPDPPAAG